MISLMACWAASSGCSNAPTLLLQQLQDGVNAQSIARMRTDGTGSKVILQGEDGEDSTRLSYGDPVPCPGSNRIVTVTTDSNYDHDLIAVDARGQAPMVLASGYLNNYACTSDGQAVMWEEQHEVHSVRFPGDHRVDRRELAGEGTYSTITRSVAPRPKVSGWYISSAVVGGTMYSPGVVARAT
jgi:hypothetical protein